MIKKQQKINAVIFDLDGTLLDTLADLATAVNRALVVNHLDSLPQPLYKQLVGSGAAHLCRAAAAHALNMNMMDVSETLADKLLADFTRFYNTGWAEATCLYSGIRLMLDDLIKHQMPMAVLSNKPDPFTQKLVEYFFPDHPFCVVYGKLNDWPKKPDPSLALEICRLMNTRPHETALVGDSGSDMATALNGGFLPIGVRWGFREDEELLAGGAKWLAEDAQDLTRMLLDRCHKEDE